MPTRSAEAKWHGNLIEGKGAIKLGSGAFEGPYDWRGRSADGAGTNPEELIAAAHAGCYSMALSHELSTAGTPPKSIHTSAQVTLEQVDNGFAITKIHLVTEAEIPGIDADAFQKYAESAKKNCPVSKVLAGAEITLQASLI